MQKNPEPSIWNKGFNWIANKTIRHIQTFLTSYQPKKSQPKKLCFQDYLQSPELAKQAGLICIRQMRQDYIKRKQGIQKAVGQYKSKSHKLNQKPHQLLCPICLELYNGPVTTSCSHTFCHMCLDEAILFNATCPVCRTQIRGEQLIVSKSVKKIILTILHKLDYEEVHKFLQKQRHYADWVEQRTIKKNQIDIGDCIDVRDTEFIWCRATILDILPRNLDQRHAKEQVLVHYEGWASIYDQVISLDSQRLASYKFYTSRVEIPHYNLSQDNNEHLRSAVVTGEVFNNMNFDIGLMERGIFPIQNSSNSSHSIDSGEGLNMESLYINSRIRSYSSDDGSISRDDSMRRTLSLVESDLVLQQLTNEDTFQQSSIQSEVSLNNMSQSQLSMEDEYLLEIPNCPFYYRNSPRSNISRTNPQYQLEQIYRYQSQNNLNQNHFWSLNLQEKQYRKILDCENHSEASNLQLEEKLPEVNEIQNENQIKENMILFLQEKNPNFIQQIQELMHKIQKCEKQENQQKLTLFALQKQIQNYDLIEKKFNSQIKTSKSSNRQKYQRKQSINRSDFSQQSSQSHQLHKQEKNSSYTIQNPEKNNSNVLAKFDQEILNLQEPEKSSSQNLQVKQEAQQIPQQQVQANCAN